MGNGDSVGGDDEDGLRGKCHHVLGNIHLERFGQRRFVEGDRLQACSMA